MPTDSFVLSWKSLVLRGALAIAFGVIAIPAPIETATALALLWGIWALVDGVGSLMDAFSREASGGRWWLAIMGVLAILAGLLVVIQPGFGAAVLTWTIGIWLIVRGAFELVGAFTTTTVLPRWLVALSGLISLVLGVLFVLNPAAGAVSIAWALGVIALCWGVTFVAAGFAIRASERKTPERQPADTTHQSHPANPSTT
jgi:uncharacterized membrane protein HdeD (DUF308 family)